jgi:parallel beta-helix repeat protein
MVKKISCILFGLVIIFGLSLAMSLPAMAAGNTWYVDPAGTNDGSHGGSAGISAFMTIQYAIDSASDGDTIIVGAGTYAEELVVNKANLVIQSGSPLGAVIMPSATPSNQGAAIYISADGVTIDGFEVDGTTVCKNGIYGWDTSNLTIKNNKIHGAVNAWDGCGILLISWGNAGTVYNNLIKDNEVYDTGRMGIMIMDHDGTNYTVTSGNTITGNAVHDVWKMATEWSDGGGGIQINVGKNCTITENTVYNVQDGQRGIYMFGSATGNVIEYNTVRDNPTGIQVWISGDGGDPIAWGSDTATSPQVKFNSIYNNATGALSYNQTGTFMTLEAGCNWWGNASGPYHATTNTSGSGNAVSDNVDYSPWWGANYVGDAHTAAWTWHTNDSIQAAVDAATAGDTINVAAGTYNEQVIISKALTVQGAGDNTVIQPDQTTIDGMTLFDRYLGSGNTEAAIVVVTGADSSEEAVLLKDFKVDASLASRLPGGADMLEGIFYRNSNGTIDNLTVNGCGTSIIGETNGGIRCVGFAPSSVTVEIRNCNVLNYTKNGITGNESNLTVNIHDNTVTGLGVISWSAQNGIQLGFGAAGTISNNTVLNHGYNGSGTAWATGLLVSESNNITVSGNTVTHNQAGIYISKSNNCAVSGNTISNTTDDQAGIMVSNYHDVLTATGNIISDNTITGGYAGIWSSYCSGNTYSNNTISGCTGNGIYFWDTDGNTIQNNTISNVHNTNVPPDAWGIALDGGDTPTGTIGSDNNTVSGNTINSSDVGIWIGNGSDNNIVESNTITGNLTGIEIGTYSGGAESAGNSIHFNNITGNTGSGVNNTTTIVADATGNWWGNASGPYHATTNTSGSGNAVSDNVDYSPWWGVNYVGNAHTAPWTWYTNDSIQEAINTATAGDTVIVEAGTYTENVIVNKSLTLTGASAATTIIDGDGSGIVVQITANNTHFSGFTVQNSGADPLANCGIGLAGVTGCVIENNTVSNNGSAGIALQQANNNTVQNNTLSNNYVAGIALLGSSNNTIQNNNSSNTNLFPSTDYGYGIVLDSINTGSDHVVDILSSTNIISGNTFSGNAMDGIYFGERCDENTVSDNTITNNGNDGIYFWKASSNKVTSNTITGNTAEGIQMMASQNNDIVGNVISGNATGMLIRSGYIDIGTGWSPHVSSGNRINFNNIFGNTTGMAYQDNTDYADDDTLSIDAINNWWGDDSGPSGEGPGSGNTVSVNIAFTPWLGATVQDVIPETITDTVLDAKEEANLEVLVDGTATVTIAEYNDNPGNGSFTGDLGKYVDVYIGDTSGVNEIEIRLYYTNADLNGHIESMLTMNWWNGNEWVACSNTGVNTADIAGPPAYSGYMWAIINDTTTPSLADLTGTAFGGGGFVIPQPTYMPPIVTSAPPTTTVPPTTTTTLPPTTTTSVPPDGTTSEPPVTTTGTIYTTPPVITTTTLPPTTTPTLMTTPVIQTTKISTTPVTTSAPASGTPVVDWIIGGSILGGILVILVIVLFVRRT